MIHHKQHYFELTEEHLMSCYSVYLSINPDSNFTLGKIYVVSLKELKREVDWLGIENVERVELIRKQPFQVMEEVADPREYQIDEIINLFNYSIKMSDVGL